MALSDQSTGDKNTIYAPLKGAQDVDMVELAGAGQPDDLHVRRIGKPHHAREICGCKGAVVARKGKDIRFPPFRCFMGFFNRSGLDLFS